MVNVMTIYTDVLFLINFIFDFMLLLTVNVALKRYSKIFRMVLASLLGSISLISLFVPMSSLLLNLLKIVMGFIMVIVAFGYKNMRYTFYNALYLYMTSIILGGFLYYLKVNFSYSKGFSFYYKGIGFNYIYLIIGAPIILIVFIKSLKALKEVKNYYYRVKIVFKDNYEILVVGFLDTGNKLKDPVTGKSVILLNRKILKGKYNIRSPMYVPYNGLNSHGLLECVKPVKLIINDKELNNYLVGFSDASFKLNGIDCLLNYKILEDI